MKVRYIPITLTLFKMDGSFAMNYNNKHTTQVYCFLVTKTSHIMLISFRVRQTSEFSSLNLAIKNGFST